MSPPHLTGVSTHSGAITSITGHDNPGHVVDDYPTLIISLVVPYLSRQKEERPDEALLISVAKSHDRKSLASLTTH